MASNLSCTTLSCGIQEIEELKRGANVIFYTKLVNLSAFTVLLYDYILTLASEKKLIWIRYLTLAAVSFIIVVMFTPNLSREVSVPATFFLENEADLKFSSFTSITLRCNSWSKFHWFAGVTIVMLTEVTLQVRLYAMYGKSRVIMTFMIFTFFATFGTILMFIGRVVGRSSAEFESFAPSNSIYFCIPVNMPPYFRDVWVPLFVHEVVLMALAVNKGIRSLRSQRETGYISRFTVVLVRDSVLIYFSVFGAFFTLELVWTIGGVNYIEVPFGFAVVLGSIMSQRLLLKTRHFFSKTEIQRTYRGTKHITSGERDDIALATLRTL